jgi:hypothetical protein
MEKLFISILFIVAGILLFILFLYLYKKSKDSKQWNKTKGVILQADLDELVMDADSPVTYKVKLEYSYIVEEETYYSKRIFYGDFLRHSSLGDIEKNIDKYRKEKIVDVYYNPQSPNEVVLQQGIHSNVTVILITSLLLSLIGIILI